MKFTLAIIGFFIILFSPKLILAEESLTDVFYEATALAQINLKSLPRTEVVRLQGSLDGKNNHITDADHDGKPDIEIEIVSLNLTGVSPVLGEVSLKNGLPDKKNKLIAEQIIDCARRFQTLSNVSCPVQSFFDIFVELRHTPLHNSAVGVAATNEVLTSCRQVHLAGIGNSLIDLSGHYTQRISGKITLCGRDGKPAGSLQIYSLKLHKLL